MQGVGDSWILINILFFGDDKCANQLTTGRGREGLIRENPCFRSIVPVIRPRFDEAALKREFRSYIHTYIHAPLGIKGLLIFPSFHATFFSLFFSALHRAEIVTSFHSISTARHRHPANPCQPFFSLSLSLSLSLDGCLVPGGKPLLISVERPQDSFRARNNAADEKLYPIDNCAGEFNQSKIISINCNPLDSLCRIACIDR